MMKYHKFDGIVIKEVNTGEADKFITLLTKQGIITVFAKGARRNKSNFAAGTQFLCYSTFVLYKSGDVYNLNSYDIIDSFYSIREDVYKLTYCAHMVDILKDVIPEYVSSSKVLKLLLNCIHFMSLNSKNSELITRIFELRLMAILGYTPYVKGCLNCDELDFENINFSFSKCGFLCNNCLMLDNFPLRLSTGAAKTLFFIINAKLSSLFNFDVSESVLNELIFISRKYLNERLEKEYNKLEFLKELK